ncbi:MAG: hypothetical protein COA79_22235 [Planctomycetota bacterium]|nr:MAG: hypothetical protein COA79_22235 [Planctomycetota bacterium]
MPKVLPVWMLNKFSKHTFKNVNHSPEMVFFGLDHDYLKGSRYSGIWYVWYSDGSLLNVYSYKNGRIMVQEFYDEIGKYVYRKRYIYKNNKLFKIETE